MTYNETAAFADAEESSIPDIDEEMNEAAARDARFCFGPDPFPPAKENA